MRFVISISFSPMCSQLRPRIATTLKRKYLQIFNAQVAVEQLVRLAHVVLKLAESAEWPGALTPAHKTLMFQQLVIVRLDGGRLKVHSVTVVQQILLVVALLQLHERFYCSGKDDLEQDNSAVKLLQISSGLLHGSGYIFHLNIIFFVDSMSQPMHNKSLNLNETIR